MRRAGGPAVTSWRGLTVTGQGPGSDTEREAPTNGEPYRLEPHASALRPGVDVRPLNRLDDELESASLLARMVLPGSRTR